MGNPHVRTSQGNSAHSGVTSDYLEEVGNPGKVAHGTTMESAISICEKGLDRMDRLHIHLGRMIEDRRGERPVGIRGNAETGIVFDGTERMQREE